MMKALVLLMVLLMAVDVTIGSAGRMLRNLERKKLVLESEIDQNKNDHIKNNFKGRILDTHYISYGGMAGDEVPCKDNSCHATQANPYHSACTAQTRCARDSNNYGN
ncbi:hypothetical protein SUGI_0201970 [Cryptomeria japonica]|nr:hypothetical protein SUGI_0201970 [Cryptomeria japonica]